MNFIEAVFEIRINHKYSLINEVIWPQRPLISLRQDRNELPSYTPSPSFRLMSVGQTLSFNTADLSYSAPLGYPVMAPIHVTSGRVVQVVGAPVPSLAGTLHAFVVPRIVILPDALGDQDGNVGAIIVSAIAPDHAGTHAPGSVAVAFPLICPARDPAGDDVVVELVVWVVEARAQLAGGVAIETSLIKGACWHSAEPLIVATLVPSVDIANVTRTTQTWVDAGLDVTPPYDGVVTLVTTAGGVHERPAYLPSPSPRTVTVRMRASSRDGLRVRALAMSADPTFVATILSFRVVSGALHGIFPGPVPHDPLAVAARLLPGTCYGGACVQHGTSYCEEDTRGGHHICRCQVGYEGVTCAHRVGHSIGSDDDDGRESRDSGNAFSVLVGGIAVAVVIFLVMCLLATTVAALSHTKGDRFMLRVTHLHSGDMAALREANGEGREADRVPLRVTACEMLSGGPLTDVPQGGLVESPMEP